MLEPKLHTFGIVYRSINYLSRRTTGLSGLLHNLITIPEVIICHYFRT